ncbi:MAG: hypothetical protein PF961_09750 [Planctomycetota bacterium]|jgi:hypothetical protein|nr:hypothetical protein [Planctomycetota bacterium]
MDEDITPQHVDIIQPSQELDGFDLYEKGTKFLASLGIPGDQLATYPQILLTTVGSLLKQVDGYLEEIDELSEQTRNAHRHVHRLRGQRDALVAALQAAGIDPTGGKGAGTEAVPWRKSRMPEDDS